MQETFEGSNPPLLKLTDTNASDVQVHFAGVTEECAAQGKRSLKIDLTIADGHYAYWMMPVDYPFTHPMKMRGKILVQGDVAVALGYYYKNPDAGLSGMVRDGEKVKDLSAGWSQWECFDPGLLDSAQPLHLQAIGIYIRTLPGSGTFSKTHAVVYVDDLEVTRLPKPKPKGQAPMLEEIGEYKVFPVAAITEERILSSSPVIPDRMKRDSLRMTAARDEYESASFAILAGKDLQNVDITVTDLTCNGQAISSIDVLAVKCWFVLNDYNKKLNFTKLSPELLLHDDDLVRVDLPKVQQSVRVTTSEGNTKHFDISRRNPDLKEEYVIEDSPSLRPLAIRRFEPKQFWITVRVPADAAAGTYRGIVHIKPANAEACELPLTLEVLAFRLPPSRLEYSLYYRAKLKMDGPAVISSDWKTERQLEAELRDMKAHGVTNPNVYDAGAALERYLTIWDTVGMSKERLFLIQGANDKLELQPERLAIGRRFGFGDVYVHGYDEARGDLLRNQRPAWQRVRSLGLKVFVACGPDFYDLVGDILDAPVTGRVNPDMAAKVHQRGFRIYVYGSPQYGINNPYIYRRKYGLNLWKAGFDGAMNYAYQHALKKHPWNNLAGHVPHKVTYPTTSGVVGTIAWEGFREAVDDVRYVTLLLNLLDEADRKPATQGLAKEIRTWLDDLSLVRDLDIVRAELAQKIFTVQAALQP